MPGCKSARRPAETGTKAAAVPTTTTAINSGSARPHRAYRPRTNNPKPTAVANPASITRAGACTAPKPNTVSGNKANTAATAQPEGVLEGRCSVVSMVTAWYFSVSDRRGFAVFSPRETEKSANLCTRDYTYWCSQPIKGQKCFKRTTTITAKPRCFIIGEFSRNAS